MIFYCFGIKNTSFQLNEIKHLIDKISFNTNTNNLVVSLYLLDHVSHHHRGRAYVSQWLHPRQFTTGRGYWRFTKNWEIPENLPMQYKLIRMVLQSDTKAYPKKELDIYGWQFKYESFEDHLALLYAHELHHYRRYHLGLHPKEGEHKANQWALELCQNLGYQVTGHRILQKTKKKKRNLIKTLYDPYKPFRSVKKGDKILIIKDPLNRYKGQFAEVMRPIRSNSKRMVIRTHDDKTWRWPLNWLKRSD